MYEKRYGIWDGYVYGRRGTKVVVVVYVMYVLDMTNSNPVFRNPHHLVGIDFSSSHGGNKKYGKYGKSSENKVRSE